MPRAPAPTAGTTPLRPCPRGADPAVWRLGDALGLARRRLPYATAEARLLDGLERWVVLGAKAVGPDRLTAGGGPRWAAVLAAVAAVSRLCSAEAQAVLAPWSGLGAAGPVAAPGVSPHAAAAAAFVVDNQGAGPQT